MPDYTYTVDGTILSINNVGVAFGEHVVLKGVNGKIQNLVRPNMTQGQVNGVIGPSGRGKTQLFRRMAGLDIPGATLTGSVMLGNTDVPVRPGLVGVVAQKYPLFMHRRVLGNLVIAGRRAGLSKESATERAMALLEEFDLRDRYNHWPAQLSGGQQQRVAIAQQLMCSEHIVLLDEPFSGLDPLMVDKTSELIQQVANRDEYNTIVVVTHEISAAVAIADHIWVIGRDRNPDGSFIPGAYLKHEFDLIERGLAWRPDIRRQPEFQDFVSFLRGLFNEL